MTFRISILMALLLAICWVSNAQTDNLSLVFHEKIFLHTDRSQYVAGDTLWFKAYLIGENRHISDSINSTIHCVLVNSDSKTIKHIITKAKSGGQITLPDTLQRGYYQVVAYTNFMHSEQPESIFRKTIYVWSNRIDEAMNSSQLPNNQLLQFFPEGGHLVEGLPSRVVYKTNVSHPATITIKDNKDQVINQFDIEKSGIGIFSITPTAGTNYHGVITDSYGKELIVELPMAFSSGYTITTDNLFSRKGILLSINKTSDVPSKIKLLVHLRENVVVNQVLNLKTSTYTSILPNALFNEGGVVHIVLLDTLNKSLAERLVWLHENLNVLTLKSEIIKKTVKDSLIAVEISAKDVYGKPVQTPISISVAENDDEISLTNNAQKYFSVFADVESEIPDELISDSLLQRIQLDYWLIANRWRYSDLNFSKPIKQDFNFSRNTFAISGQVINKEKRVHTKRTAQAYIKSSSTLIPIPISFEQDGRFTIDGLSFEGKASMWIQKDNDDISRSLTTILPPLVKFVPSTLTKLPKQNSHISQAMAKVDTTIFTNQSLNTVRQLAEVTIKSKKIDPMQNDDRRQLYGGKPDYEIILTDKNINLGIEGALKSFVPGCSPNSASYYIDGFLHSKKGGQEGINNNIYDISGKLGISVYDIDRIDVLTRGTNIGIFGVSGGTCVVNIITKRGSATIVKQNVGNIQDIEGYQIPINFNTNLSRSSFSTLYWNSELMPNEEGKAIIYIQTSHATNKIKIRVNALTSSGQVGSSEQFFDLK